MKALSKFQLESYSKSFYVSSTWPPSWKYPPLEFEDDDELHPEITLDEAVGLTGPLGWFPVKHTSASRV